ncbi:vitamin K-dependent gamma-carboxylase [Battus philenor]|uniref:vitamin K-dependent gamma-carboxylase n=1 Tax=Battus philenor TaxID=42288 RepID=UPI0035CEB9FF
MKERIKLLHDRLDAKFFEQFGFHISDTNVRNIVVYMHKPKHASSLAVTRILFGIAMLFDIPDERGGAAMTERWGSSTTCHFPLIYFIQALPMPYMAIIYLALWLGALGIALGYKFRASASIFAASFWYLLLVDKSYWNNHSYLFALVGLLLSFTEANCYWSLDAHLEPSLSSQTVPYWNYFILKYQFFILYFMAGVKKGSAEWLSGYSVLNLSEHWVFNPIKLFLTVRQTDYLIVHWFVFAFDLTVAFWMMWSRTRHVAMIFCALFHLMNSRLFRIGMFPWVCLATMPLFYPFHWPKLVESYLRKICSKSKTKLVKWIFALNNKLVKNDNVAAEVTSSKKKENEEEKTIDEVSKKDLDNQIETLENYKERGVNGENNDSNKISKISKSEPANTELKHERKQTMTCIVIGLYVVSQAFLPFSHFITKGYNNWTNGLYGYSWDMMVHTWDVHSVVVKVVDNERNAEFYVDPYHFTGNDRWSRHGDMVHQYARCLRDNIYNEVKKRNWNDPKHISGNISIYIDVWSSLNGRFTQRMFDSKVDILNTSWSPFAPVSYLMPLLDEGLDWRERLFDIREVVHSWNNKSDVLFIADFPGYVYERYIPTELRNVTLTILDGVVVHEPELSPKMISKSNQLEGGDSINLASGIFHKVHNIGKKTAFYMYTFYNSTDVDSTVIKPAPKLPIANELLRRFNNMKRFLKNIISSLLKIYFKLSKCQ